MAAGRFLSRFYRGQRVAGVVGIVQALETDTAPALGRAKRTAIGQALETETAQALGRAHVRALGQAVETDLAQVVVWAPKVRLLGQAFESDVAAVLGRLKVRKLGEGAQLHPNPGFETNFNNWGHFAELIGGQAPATFVGRVTDFSRSGVASGKYVVNVTGGTDQAHYALWGGVFSEQIPIAGDGPLALEGWIKAPAGRTVFIRGVRKIAGVQQYGTAQDVIANFASTGDLQFVSVALPAWGGAGTTSGLDFRIGLRTAGLQAGDTFWADDVRVVTTGPATEIDSAQPLGRVRSRVIAVALEADAAQPLGRLTTKTLGQAFESDVAQGLSGLKRRILGQALESDLAQSLAVVGGGGLLGQALEVELAQALARRETKAIGQALELDTAALLAALKRSAIAGALEVDLAQALGRAKARGLQPALELDVAHGLGRLRVRALQPALELDTALALMLIGGPAVPADILLLALLRDELQLRGLHAAELMLAASLRDELG